MAALRLFPGTWIRMFFFRRKALRFVRFFTVSGADVKEPVIPRRFEGRRLSVFFSGRRCMKLK
jgi:large subunit ribosomal protein L28